MTSRLNLNDPQQLTRLVWLMLTAVVLLAATFAGYYYFDRYVHLDDQSPIDQSIIQMEEVVHQNPEDADARVGLAQTYLQNGRYDQSLQQIEQVLNAYPEHHGALFVQGIAYAQSGETAASIEPLAKLVVLRRQSPMAQTDNMLQTALYYLGQSYLDVGRTDFAPAFLGLGLTYEQLGLLADAENYLTHALALDPDNFLASHALGRVQHVMAGQN